jgi:hypothetical protein
MDFKGFILASPMASICFQDFFQSCDLCRTEGPTGINCHKYTHDTSNNDWTLVSATCCGSGGVSGQQWGERGLISSFLPGSLMDLHLSGM